MKIKYCLKWITIIGICGFNFICCTENSNPSDSEISKIMDNIENSNSEHENDFDDNNLIIKTKNGVKYACITKCVQIEDKSVAPSPSTLTNKKCVQRRKKLRKPTKTTTTTTTSKPIVAITEKQVPPTTLITSSLPSQYATQSLTTTEKLTTPSLPFNDDDDDDDDNDTKELTVDDLFKMYGSDNDEDVMDNFTTEKVVVSEEFNSKIQTTSKESITTTTTSPDTTEFTNISITYLEPNTTIPSTSSTTITTMKTLSTSSSTTEEFDYITECEDNISTESSTTPNPFVNRILKPTTELVSVTTEIPLLTTTLSIQQNDEFIMASTETTTTPKIMSTLNPTIITIPTDTTRFTTNTIEAITNAKTPTTTETSTTAALASTTTPESTTTLTTTTTTELYEYETDCVDYEDKAIIPTTTEISCCPDSICKLIYPNLNLCMSAMIAANRCNQNCQLDKIHLNLKWRIAKLRDLLVIYEIQKLLCFLRSDDLAHEKRLEKFEKDIISDWNLIYLLTQQLNGTDDEYWNILQNILTTSNFSNNNNMFFDDDPSDSLNLSKQQLTNEQLNILKYFIKNSNKIKTNEFMEDVINTLYKDIIDSEMKFQSHHYKNINLNNNNNNNNNNRNENLIWKSLHKKLLQFKENSSFIEKTNKTNEIDILIINLLKNIDNSTKINNTNYEKYLLEKILYELQFKIEKLINEKINFISNKFIPTTTTTTASSSSPSSPAAAAAAAARMKIINAANINNIALAKTATTTIPTATIISKENNKKIIINTLLNKTDDEYDEINLEADRRQNHYSGKNEQSSSSTLSLDKNALGIILRRPYNNT